MHDWSVGAFCGILLSYKEDQFDRAYEFFGATPLRFRRAMSARRAFTETIPMKPTHLFLAFVLGLSISLPLHAASISGSAKITDGDTIEILGMPIRLEGIDAPESEW